MSIGGNLPEGIKFPLVFVICVLDTFLYNFAFAAYTGLMIPLAPDPTERTGLAGARSQINSIGKVFFGFVAVAAIAFIGKLFNNEAAGYTGFMVLIVIAILRHPSSILPRLQNPWILPPGNPTRQPRMELLLKL